MRKISKTNLMLLAVSLSMLAAPAFAATAGDMAEGVFQQLSSFADLFMGAIFLAGLGIGGAAAFKFKAHSENAQQVPLKVPLTYAAVAAICIGLPAFLMMGTSTLFGEDGARGSMEEGSYNQISG